MGITTDKAKEILEGIKSYENTMDLIENHSVSVQDACAIGINAIEKVERYKKAIEEFYTRVDYDCSLVSGTPTISIRRGYKQRSFHCF